MFFYICFCFETSIHKKVELYLILYLMDRCEVVKKKINRLLYTDLLNKESGFSKEETLQNGQVETQGPSFQMN